MGLLDTLAGAGRTARKRNATLETFVWANGLGRACCGIAAFPAAGFVFWLVEGNRGFRGRLSPR